VSDGGGIPQHLRFRPNPDTDGAFERAEGVPIPVSAPDWDRALELLRKINTLQDVSGKRVSTILVEEGFEPWWYGQDRLLRFYLVPLTQLFPLLQAVAGARRLRVENAPPDLDRVLRAIEGKAGFPSLEGAQPRRAKGFLGQGALLLLSMLSLAAFRILRRDTLLYIIDHVSPGLRLDFRFAPLYAELERGGFRCAEYAHTLSPRQALKNFFRRRRPVFFLEAADFAASLAFRKPAAPAAEMRVDGSDSVESRALKALVPTVLAGCAQSVARQRVLKRALRFQRVRRAVIFDDNRHNHELVAACVASGIPVLGFQHGVFNQFHAGLMAYGFSGARAHAFDRYGVWSGLFRDRLLRYTALYTPGQVFVAGPVRPPEASLAAPDRPKTDSASGGTIRVLVVSEPLARKREAAAYLQALLKDPRFELRLKIRPGESAQSLEEYSLPADRVRLLQTGTVYEAFAQADVAVGTYSTVLYEAVLAGLPIVWMKTTRAYGRELVEERLAEAAEKPEDCPDAVIRAVALPGTERDRRRKLLWGQEIRNGAVSLVQALRQLETA
jgi:hypothetical protein